MADTPTETKPPAIDTETGVAMDGDFPHNHRLRAEALSRAGEESDPDGLVSDDLIADAGARMEAAEKAAKEAEEEAKRSASALRNMTTAELEDQALKDGVDLSSAKNNGERADLIEAARNAPATIDSDNPAAPPPVSDDGRADSSEKA